MNENKLIIVLILIVVLLGLIFAYKIVVTNLAESESEYVLNKVIETQEELEQKEQEEIEALEKHKEEVEKLEKQKELIDSY